MLNRVLSLKSLSIWSYFLLESVTAIWIRYSNITYTEKLKKVCSGVSNFDQSWRGGGGLTKISQINMGGASISSQNSLSTLMLALLIIQKSLLEVEANREHPDLANRFYQRQIIKTAKMAYIRLWQICRGYQDYDNHLRGNPDVVVIPKASIPTLNFSLVPN